MANSDPMGLAGAYGSASIPQTLDDLVKQRYLQQQIALRMAEEQRQRQEMAQREAITRAQMAEQTRQFGATQGLNERKFAQEVREAGPKTAYTEALTNSVTGSTARAAKRDTDEEAALAQVPEQLRPILKLFGAQPVDLQLEDKQRGNQRLAAIQQSGSRGAASGKPSEIRRNVMRDGQQGTLYRYADGTEEFEPSSTADLTNRRKFMEQFAGTIKTMKDAWMAARPGTHEGMGALYEGAKATGGALTRTNTPAKTYRDMRNGAGFFLARVLGSNSQLSDAEREAAADMVLPDLFDSTDVAKTKFLLVQRLMDTQGDQAQYDAMIRQLLSGGLGSAAQTTGPEVGTDLGAEWGERRTPARPKPMSSHPR